MAMWYANKHGILWHTGILFLQFLRSHNCRCDKVHSSIISVIQDCSFSPNKLREWLLHSKD